jgi:hypothetical protein
MKSSKNDGTLRRNLRTARPGKTRSFLSGHIFLAMSVSRYRSVRFCHAITPLSFLWFRSSKEALNGFQNELAFSQLPMQ